VILKRSKDFCVECTNGDIHLILKDLENRVYAKYGENLDEADVIKKIMKEEASKPLFLMRNYN
jgi:hypothetical protein